MEGSRPDTSGVGVGRIKSQHKGVWGPVPIQGTLLGEVGMGSSDAEESRRRLDVGSLRGSAPAPGRQARTDTSRPPGSPPSPPSSAQPVPRPWPLSPPVRPSLSDRRPSSINWRREPPSSLPKVPVPQRLTEPAGTQDDQGESPRRTRRDTHARAHRRVRAHRPRT